MPYTQGLALLDLVLTAVITFLLLSFCCRKNAEPGTKTQHFIIIFKEEENWDCEVQP